MELVWKVHRLREEPERIPVIAAAYAVVASLSWLLFHSPLTVLLFLAVLTGALTEFLFPLAYRLTAQGARQSCGLSQLFIPWSEVRRATHGREGICLSPFASPSALDSFRGVRLRYGTQNPEMVRAVTKRLWKGDPA